MKYTVIWRPSALNELTELWLDAVDRDAVTLAAARIDRLLGAAPEEQGESREDNTRVLLIEPLGIEYEIDDADRKVHVNTTWLIL